MDPFLNNDFTNKNATIGGYTNPTNVNKSEYVYTTSNDINLETYFNQPYTENNSNSYNITYLPGRSEAVKLIIMNIIIILILFQIKLTLKKIIIVIITIIIHFQMKIYQIQIIITM